MKCKKCGSDNLWKIGNRMSPNGHMQRYQCQNCGHVFEVLKEK